MGDGNSERCEGLATHVDAETGSARGGGEGCGVVCGLGEGLEKEGVVLIVLFRNGWKGVLGGGHEEEE